MIVIPLPRRICLAPRQGNDWAAGVGVLRALRRVAIVHQGTLGWNRGSLQQKSLRFRRLVRFIGRGREDLNLRPSVPNRVVTRVSWNDFASASAECANDVRRICVVDGGGAVPGDRRYAASGSALASEVSRRRARTPCELLRSVAIVQTIVTCARVLIQMPSGSGKCASSSRP